MNNHMQSKRKLGLYSGLLVFRLGTLIYGSPHVPHVVVSVCRADDPVVPVVWGEGRGVY